MHVDAEPLAEHAARVADAAAAVDREADRDRVDDLRGRPFAHAGSRARAPRRMSPSLISCPAMRDLGADDARGREAARQVDDDLARSSRRPSARRRGRRCRIEALGRLEVDDHAAAHAARDLVADADDARLVVLDPGDEAADLGGADIERGDQAAARPRRRDAPSPCRHRAAGGSRRLARAGSSMRHVFFAGGRPFLAGVLRRFGIDAARPAGRAGACRPICTSRSSSRSLRSSAGELRPGARRASPRAAARRCRCRAAGSSAGRRRGPPR